MFVVFQVLNEAEDNYNIEVNKSQWEDRYDFASDVNTQVQPIKNSLDTISNQDEGWLNKVGAGFTGIIAAITFLPGMLWSIMTLSTGLSTGLGVALAIPAYLITVIIVRLIVWGVFKLIEFFQRWNV